MPRHNEHPVTLKMRATTCINESPVRIRRKVIFDPSNKATVVSIFSDPDSKKHPVLVERFTDQGTKNHFEWPKQIDSGFREGRISEVVGNGFECPRCSVISAGVQDLEELLKNEREAIDWVPNHLLREQAVRIEFLEHGKSFLDQHH